MAAKDGFAPDDPFPIFLSEHAEEREQPGMQPGIRKAWDGAVISSRILKTGILVVTAAAIDLAIPSVGNPVALFANVTASLVDISAFSLAPVSRRQQFNQRPALPPTARDAPTRDEITTALEPADQSQTEIRQPSAETLLKQFQAWAAEQETRDEITGALQPADQSQTEIRQPSAEALLKKFQAWAAEQDARAQIGPVVLHGLDHPLRECEVAVDLTAMLLGYRDFNLDGCEYIETRPKAFWPRFQHELKHAFEPSNQTRLVKSILYLKPPAARRGLLALKRWRPYAANKTAAAAVTETATEPNK
jgi:hypothetical protein